MDTQKLHDLIDKVIGKEGPLRTPAYWMRMVLVNFIDFIVENILRMESKISYIQSKFTLLAANALQKTPHYTYNELKHLKDNNMLVPGQVYETTYESQYSMSSFVDGLGGSYYLQYSNSYRLLLTAIGNNGFSSDAIAYESNTGTKFNVKYNFERTNKFAWCAKTNEVAYLYASRTGENRKYYFNLDRSYSNEDTRCIRYYTWVSGAIGPVYIYINDGEQIKVGDIFKVETNEGELSFTIEEIRDSFSGFIYEWYDPVNNIRTPFIPGNDMLFSFQIERTGLEPFTVEERPIWGSYGYSYFRNVTIRPYSKDGIYYLPRIAFNYVQNVKDTSIYIGYNSTHIYIDWKVDKITDSPIYIGDNCKDIFIYRAPGVVYLNPGQTKISLIGSSAKFIGASSRVTLDSYDMTATKDAPIFYRVSDVFLNIKKDESNVYGKITVSCSKYGDSETPMIINLSETNDFEYCTIGTDSNGNVRCWNPADYVDAIEPEETSVIETTEE